MQAGCGQYRNGTVLPMASVPDRPFGGWEGGAVVRLVFWFDQQIGFNTVLLNLWISHSETGFHPVDYLDVACPGLSWVVRPMHVAGHRVTVACYRIMPSHHSIAPAPAVAFSKCSLFYNGGTGPFSDQPVFMRHDHNECHERRDAANNNGGGRRAG